MSLIRKCIIRNCPSGYVQVKTRLIFHKIPLDKNDSVGVRQKWLDFIGNSLKETPIPSPKKNWKVCCLHFKPEDFSNFDYFICRQDVRLLLKPHAFPTAGVDSLNLTLWMMNFEVEEPDNSAAGVIADLSNVIYLVEEDIKPDVSALSCQDVTNSTEGVDHQDPLSLTAFYSDVKNETYLTIKHETIDYENSSEGLELDHSKEGLDHQKCLSTHCKSEIITSNPILNNIKHEDIDGKNRIETYHTELYKCSICTEDFSTNSELTVHEIVLSGKKSFKCSYCHQEFCAERNLDLHKRKQNHPFECNYCDKVFSSKQHLVSHIIGIHTGENPFKCSRCDEAFSSKRNLVSHIRAHDSEKPFECSYCDKKFFAKSTLYLHIRMHTSGKPFKCSHCDEAFTIRQNLVTHLRVHSGEKPFKCSYCNKSFSTKHSVVSHIRIHTREKPIKCSYCDKAFTRHSCLIRHVRVHTGEKPYKCTYCDKAFSYKPSLVSHLRAHTDEKAK